MPEMKDIFKSKNESGTSEEFKPGDRVCLAQFHDQKGEVLEVIRSQILGKDDKVLVRWDDDGEELEEDPDDLEKI